MKKSEIKNLRAQFKMEPNFIKELTEFKTRIVPQIDDAEEYIILVTDKVQAVIGANLLVKSGLTALMNKLYKSGTTKEELEYLVELATASDKEIRTQSKAIDIERAVDSFKKAFMGK